MAWTLPINFVNETQGLMEGMAIWANDVTFGIFWAALLLGFCIVLFMATGRFGLDRAFGFSSFTGLLGAMILVTLNLMSWGIASLFILAGILGLVYMIVNKER